MVFADMDPSCTIGFSSRSVRHYERIGRELSEVSGVNTQHRSTRCLVLPRHLSPLTPHLSPPTPHHHITVTPT